MLGTHKKSPPRFPKAGSLVTELLAFAPRRVPLPWEFFEGAKERAGLADEQSVVNEGLNSAHGCTLGFCWPDDRHRRELFAQEDGRLRHDEIGLEIGVVGIRVHPLRSGRFHRQTERRTDGWSAVRCPQLPHRL